MEHVQANNKFKILNRVEIAKGEFTFDNAVEKIKYLNVLYDPVAIYIDRGAGEYQIETLRKYGMDHPETGLAQKIVGIQFSQVKEIMDPFTKMKSKKAIKPFMVNQLSLILERDRLMISDKDDMIIKELENYRVIKETVNGNPVFTKEDEHTIDCMGLCILGFIERLPELVDTITVFKAANTIASLKITINNKLEQLVKEKGISTDKSHLEWDEPGARPAQKVPVGSKPNRQVNFFGWSTRGSNIKREHKRSSW